jgi:tetratricopeptide (TPR) repeat protein
MNRILFLSSAAFAAAVALASPAFAQAGYPQPIVAQPNPDADRLGDEMRILAQNPRDLRALLSAAEISTRLDDTSAALAFYARAEAIEPENPRIFAGRAAALVRLQRPGEAMRLFQQAEQRGLPMADYAADRGLAYDLLGNPALAQRDYKVALGRGRADETLRRYALSLGITGRPDEAMAVLDPLLRRSDRAAWRARAFILAMNGDVAGAERISTSMMPGNMGAALTPFFRRLSSLTVGDKAFAVHFGQLSPTQARRADAAMAPQLPAYIPEAPRLQVAAAAPVAAPVRQGRDRRSRRERERDDLAATTSAALRASPKVAAAPPLPPPPEFRQQVAMVQPLPTPAPVPRAAPAPAPTPPPGRFAARFPETPARAPARLASAAPARPIVTPQLPAAAEALDDAGDGPGEDLAPATIAPAVRPPQPVRVGQEDAALAAIVGNITIPAAELGVTPMPGEVRTEPSVAAPAPAPEPVRIATPPPVEAKAPPKPAPKPRTEAPKPGAKPPTAADAAKAKKKPEPPKPKPAPEPKRVWVQVAGGANESTLASSWRKLVKQAPAAFRGKTAWTTPLRATNRVLAGPFKTADEAQAWVNMLRKADISAFVFTSEAGQKITKLDLK